MRSLGTNMQNSTFPIFDWQKGQTIFSFLLSQDLNNKTCAALQSGCTVYKLEGFVLFVIWNSFSSQLLREQRSLLGEIENMETDTLWDKIKQRLSKEVLLSVSRAAPFLWSNTSVFSQRSMATWASSEAVDGEIEGNNLISQKAFSEPQRATWGHSIDDICIFVWSSLRMGFSGLDVFV